MIDRPGLLADLKKLLKKPRTARSKSGDAALDLEDDLRTHLEEDADARDALAREYREAKANQRTALAEGAFRDEQVTQSAVAWILACVFVRFLEDNDFVAEPWLTGPGERGRRAKDRQTLYFQEHPRLSDREYLLHVIGEVAKLPGMGDLLDERTNPLFRCLPTTDGATLILETLRRVDPDSGDLIHDFTDPERNTRFLGDLYQDLSDDAKKRYALLQTPEFVESFILDYTLDPAIEEFGLADTTLIDPACGSGHFLLGAFDRLLERWQRSEPATNVRELCKRTLAQIAGVDVNPFAVAIARFRLLLAALVASGVTRLKDAPDFHTNLAVGDSLLFGERPRHGGGVQGDFLDDRMKHHFAAEDPDALRRILKPGYAAVVGNPPYITPKDAALNQAYRDRFASCHRQYSLVVPFVERMFDLAAHAEVGEGRAGFVGMIVANSFMKREFGKKLIEEYLRRKDLTHVVDLSGADVPGHGTPTVIMYARGRMPVAMTLRGVLGIRGEPGTPDDPANGLVWSEIVSGLREVGFEGRFVSVRDLARKRLGVHPWSLGGGGAAELRHAIERQTTWQLSEVTEVIGFAAITGEDDAFLMNDRASVRRFSVDRALPMVLGDCLRDWCVSDCPLVITPYDVEWNFVKDRGRERGVYRLLWSCRTSLHQRKRFGVPMIDKGMDWLEWRELYADRLRTPLSITFAEVATHNHFVLDRGGKVFKQTAPVIKLPTDATEEDHLGLLGLLNSSTACFWLQQVCHNKGGPGGACSKDEKWHDFYQLNGTKFLQFPLPDARPFAVATRTDTHAVARQSHLPAVLVQKATPTRATLDEARDKADDLLAQMIAHQEELDWECYRLYGLLADDLCAPEGTVPPLQLGQRAFEIVMARQIQAGTLQTKWFERHGSTPITDLPADWPEPYRQIVLRRIALIESDPNIRLIEQPEYKRRWNVEAWADQEQRALRGFLLDRLEADALWPKDHPVLRSCAQLADLVRRDSDFIQVAELYAGRPDFDLTDLVRDLVLDDAVPYLPILRYKPSGLRKREDWEHTWDLQRKEDAIDALGLPEAEAKQRKQDEIGDIPVPPKYGSADFLKSTWWRLRGKLDVPKERFVLYPFAERSADPTPVITWAGYDHLQQAKALATLYVDRKEKEGFDRDRLQPLLLGLRELLPWLKQWHNEVDPKFGARMGDYFEGHIEEEARAIGLTVGELGDWSPPEKARGRRRKGS